MSKEEYLQRLRTKRLENGIAQYARQIGASQERLNNVLDWLPKAAELCDEPTRTRINKQSLAKAILLSKQIRILAPTCPDWTHSNGRHTFEGLSNGISMRANLQIEFLRQLEVSGGQPVKAMIVYADQEANDKHSVIRSGGDAETFQQKVESSILATKDKVSAYGWRSCGMTRLIPDFFDREVEVMDELKENKELQKRFERELGFRINMYRRIDPGIKQGEALERVIREAAHYIILGRFAKINGYIISNTRSPDLVWYRYTGAGILHIPPSFSHTEGDFRPLSPINYF